ncbi:MAG: hypothetical protein AAF614_06515 [Chloroflexota bacterium]
MNALEVKEAMLINKFVHGDSAQASCEDSNVLVKKTESSINLMGKPTGVCQVRFAIPIAVEPGAVKPKLESVKLRLRSDTSDVSITGAEILTEDRETTSLRPLNLALYKKELVVLDVPKDLIVKRSITVVIDLRFADNTSTTSSIEIYGIEISLLPPARTKSWLDSSFDMKPEFFQKALS